MKFKDWYKFNFCNEDFECSIGDIYVKVFRKKSFVREDMVLEHLIKHEDAIVLFGDYELFVVNKDTQNGYCTLSVCIYKED